MLSSELDALFRDPPRAFGPTPLWWWSGGRVTQERIRWQMRRFAEGGIFNLVVINLAPAGPIVGARADDPPWFSDEWWARFADACEAARELDMKLWFYDQIGFSGANVQGSVTLDHPEAAGQALRSRLWSATGAAAPEFSRGERLLAAFDTSGVRRPVDEDGRIETRPGERLRLVTTVPTAFDYLSSDAVQLLMQRVHHEFDRRAPQYLGEVVVGSFQDELPATNSWTRRFAEEFAVRRGYDLTDHLHLLFDPGDSWGAKVRGDYHSVRAELTEEALFRPLSQWHSQRGMLIGCDQSNPARAGNPTQATQIYTDYFRSHRWYTAAGSDHEGDSKVHSSMAHLYGHDRVWLEAFHSSGWGGTLEDTYDWLLPFLRSGANLYNPHASYFDTVAGWFEWAPPSTDWRQPYWQQYPAFASAVARIASILSWGSYSVDVAVLHPTATAKALLTLDAPVDHFGDGQLGAPFEAVDETQRHYLALCGSNNWFVTRPGALDRAGIAFDVIDDASVQRAQAAGGALSVGHLHYSTVILPSTSVLEEQTARRLAAFVDDGGHLIVVGRPPSLAAGAAGADDVVRALASDPRANQVGDAEAAAAAIQRDTAYATSDIPLLVRRKGVHAVAFVTGAFPNASRHPLRTDAWLWKDYDFDPSRYAQVKTVAVGAPVAEAEVWDPATGERRPAQVTHHAGRSSVEVRLDGAPAVMLVWRESETRPEPAEPSATTYGHATSTDVAAPAELTGIELGDGWTGELQPTLDNTWGDFALPAGTSVSDLQIWTMDWAETDGREPRTWAPTRVTFGQRVLTSPPRWVEDGIRPLDAAAVEAVLTGSAPLAEATWESQQFSTSRGREKNAGTLGNKALVPEEFVQVRAPREGAVAAVRTIVRTNRQGPADLVVGSGAVKRVWWNGHEVSTGPGYTSVARVNISREHNVLEYHLGPSENTPAFALDDTPPMLGSFYALVEPDGFARRPEFMRAGDSVHPTGTVTYSAEFDVPGEVRGARLVCGAATGLTVSLDGKVVARQEKVEYYESAWGATPMFFAHDLTALISAPGRHFLEVISESSDPRDVVFADLAVQHPGGVATLVSGAGWRTRSGTDAGSSVEHRGHWSELAHTHSVSRSHPLPQTTWLHGQPVVGSTVDDIRSTDDLVPAAQWFRVRVPAGAVAIHLPLRLAATVSLDGVDQRVEDHGIRWIEPLRAPADLLVHTEPTVTDRGGSAWDGPLKVETARAPIQLGNWQNLGLRSWSGSVTYRHTVNIPEGADDVVLDLGRVRGSVEVAVQESPVGGAFCDPFRFRLGDLQGRVEIAVTVYNTLGPFFAEATPTTWVFPSQLESGLLGPVTLSWRLRHR